MVEIKLNWEGPFKISDIRKKFLEERLNDVIKDPSYYWITWPGIYVFIDEYFRPLYVGSATKNCTNPLRTRIREHLKGLTKFYERLKKSGLDLNDQWQLIVAPFTDDELLGNILKIEHALTCNLNPPGNFDDLEIVNLGKCESIPSKFKVGFLRYNQQKML